MLTLLLPTQTGLELQEIIQDQKNLTLCLKTTNSQAACSVCKTLSGRVQSRYQRTLADLPWADFKVKLQLKVRRFFCKNPACSRKIFSEGLERVTLPYARRTPRQLRRLQQLGLVLGGEAGARLAQLEGLLVSSADTILRLLRKIAVSDPAAPQLLGVDDFALRKGHNYGTVLVDLDKHRPIELLEDRTADTFAQWLEKHPGIDVITRDRSGAYAEAARRAAPQALQVADRFHLLVNLREAAQNTLENQRSWLDLTEVEIEPTLIELENFTQDRVEVQEAEMVNRVAQPTEVAERQVGPEAPSPKRPHYTAHRERDLELSRARREARLARYHQVLKLGQAGLSYSGIARELGLHARTVKRYLRAEAFPELAKRRHRHKKIEQYALYLQRRWDEGEHNVKILFGEVRQQGYKGGSTILYEFVRSELKHYRSEERAHPPRIEAKALPLTPRQGAWLMCLIRSS